MRLSGFPKGLLALLGSQSFGENVKDLGNIIQPTVELASLYLLSFQGSVTDVANPIAAGNGFKVGSTPIVVPAGEVWRLHQVTTFVITPAASTVTHAPAIRLDGLTISLADPYIQTASLSRWNCAKNLPLWLNAGTELGLYIADHTGAANIGSVQAVVSRLRA